MIIIITELLWSEKFQGVLSKNSTQSISRSPQYEAQESYVELRVLRERGNDRFDAVEERW